VREGAAWGGVAKKCDGGAKINCLCATLQFNYGSGRGRSFSGTRLRSQSQRAALRTDFLISPRKTVSFFQMKRQPLELQSDKCHH
jgi:hypothetical protein